MSETKDVNLYFVGKEVMVHPLGFFYHVEGVCRDRDATALVYQKVYLEVDENGRGRNRNSHGEPYIPDSCAEETHRHDGRVPTSSKPPV